MNTTSLREPALAPIEEDLPGSGLQTTKMPGHWLLARLGKKVLRPGGAAMTEQMMDALAITGDDHVVEFAPGLGATAEIALKKRPASYTAVDRDESAVTRLCKKYGGSKCRFQVGTAENNGLPNAVATVVYCEAMLTMQTADVKRRIVNEAARLLRPGGRYGIHEMSLVPDEVDESVAQEVSKALGGAIHVGVRPLRVSEWRELLAQAGLEVAAEYRAPMDLLEPRRLIADEGLDGAIQILWRALNDEPALARVLEMRSVFRKYKQHLGSICLVARKQ